MGKKQLSKQDYCKELVRVQRSGKVPFSILRLKVNGLDHNMYVKCVKSIAIEILTSMREGNRRNVVVKHSTGYHIGEVEHVNINPDNDAKNVSMRWAYSIVPECPQFYREHRAELDLIG